MTRDEERLINHEPRDSRRSSAGTDEPVILELLGSYYYVVLTDRSRYSTLGLMKME